MALHADADDDAAYRGEGNSGAHNATTKIENASKHLRGMVVTLLNFRSQRVRFWKRECRQSRKQNFKRGLTAMPLLWRGLDGRLNGRDRDFAAQNRARFLRFAFV